jgi:ParB-like chromosome segregation protein Spo0J
MDGHSLSPDDHRKLTALWTRLELLLNPDESDAVSLLKLADAARHSETAAERDSTAREMVQLARNLVKTEWVRIQIELK